MKKTIHIFLFFAFFLLLEKDAISQSTGLLIGMTTAGGTGNSGTMFSYDPITGKDTVLINFTGPNGSIPFGNVMQASNGLLYGMTFEGGTSGQGVLFSYNLNTGKDSILINFNSAIGKFPLGTMMQATDSMLYGTTMQGGTFGDGAIFRYNPVTGKDTFLFNFNGTDGTYPVGTLLQASDGKLYGMTQYGGDTNEGVIYRFDPVTGKDTVVVNLHYHIYGTVPGYQASLIQDTNKLIYGLIEQGGLYAGVLFSYNMVTGKDTALVKFPDPMNGYYPHGSMLQANNGLLYGMASQSSLNGLFFDYNTVTGKDSLLFNFNSANGAAPYGTPIQASNGLLYGMTNMGGAHDSGVLFSYNITTGKDTVLLNFNNASGFQPQGDLLEAISARVTGIDSFKCYGDSGGWAKITPRGVTMPVTYLWSNGATTDSIGNVKGGVYNCKITDAKGKSINLSINIYQPPPILPGASVSNVCFGDSNGVARINAAGGVPPYKYKWNTGATIDSIQGLKPGKDTCLITDANGCTSKAYFNITQAPPFKIDSVVSTAASCPTCSDGSATVYVSGGVPPGDSVMYSYLWTYGGDSATVHGIPTGYDYVCVTSGYYKCGSACDSTFVVTGIASVNGSSNEIRIYPVPSKGPLTFFMQGRGFQNIVISDELGRQVYQTHLDETRSDYTFTADLGGLTDGMYIVQVNTSKGIITRRIIIQK